MTALSLFADDPGPRLVRGRLAIEHEVALASRVVHLHSMLSVARTDDLAAAVKGIKADNSTVGGSLAGGWYAAGPGGVYYSATVVMPDPKRAESHVSWKRIVEMLRLGLTPGLVATGSHAYRRYCSLHSDFAGVNAVSDPLAHRTLFVPTYRECTRTMRAVERAVWGNAIAASLNLPSSFHLSLR